MAIKHSTTANPNDIVASANWNADHTGTATPTNHGNEVHTSAFITGAQVPANETDPVYTAWDKDHADLSNVTSDQHHARSHNITSTSDHTSTATNGRILKADANGLPVNATNTDADVADAVSKKHSQNTDTALGSGAVAADHGAAATDQVINVCYGTGDPPAANTTTEGALFVKYTA